MKNFGCHGNELPIKEILYQSVFGDKYYTIGHKFTISVTMDVSPFAWCLSECNQKLFKEFVSKKKIYTGIICLGDDLNKPLAYCQILLS